MLEYANKLVLAPMVRIGDLPTRLVALANSADLVWGPEIIDKKLVQCSRVVNDRLKTVDFVDKTGRLIFRTVPAVEKKQLVFQLGSSSPELAVAAGKVVAGDVSAIDLNCGCPKHFSMHAGMGAALLKTPDTLEAILRALVAEVGVPSKISISVKIRLLETLDLTYDLVKRLVKTGINHLTLHCRTTPMRSREPALYEALPQVAKICHDAGVTCYVNGDITGRSDWRHVQAKYGVDGAMIARAAETNPSCFAEQPLAWQDVAKQLVDFAGKYDNNYANTKFCLTKIVPGKEPIYQSLAKAKTHEAIASVVAEMATQSTHGSAEPATGRELSGTVAAGKRAFDEAPADARDAKKTKPVVAEQEPTPILSN